MQLRDYVLQDVQQNMDVAPRDNHEEVVELEIL